jgi:hypothetical protein
MEFLEPWFEDRDPELAKELHKETCSGHVLHRVPVSAVARRQDCDLVLFSIDDGSGRMVVVHLTYSRETSPDWPTVRVFANWHSWLESMKSDHIEFSGG